jgi:xanthine dehydrogenase/oxidase
MPVYHLRRLVKAILDRNLVNHAKLRLLVCFLRPAGTRHPFQATYKVGFTKDGSVTALDMDLYSNAGESLMYT